MEEKETGVTFNDILGGYLTEEQAKELAERLEKDLPDGESDEKLSATISQLKSFYEQPDKPKRHRCKKFFLISLVVFHFVIILGNLLAIFLLPFLTPWYVAIPLISLIINLNFTPTKCPLTMLEDSLRRSMKMPEVKLFIRYYIILPYRKWKKKKKKN
jgi:hypothetical protein